MHSTAFPDRNAAPRTCAAPAAWLGVTMQSSQRPRRSSDPLREMLAAGNPRQIAALAFVANVSGKNSSTLLEDLAGSRRRSCRKSLISCCAADISSRAWPSVENWGLDGGEKAEIAHYRASVERLRKTGLPCSTIAARLGISTEYVMKLSRRVEQRTKDPDRFRRTVTPRPHSAARPRSNPRRSRAAPR